MSYTGINTTGERSEQVSYLHAVSSHPSTCLTWISRPDSINDGRRSL